MDSVNVSRTGLASVVTGSFRSCAIFAAACCLAMVSTATVRHVDYANGADSGDATAAPGWKTLAYAVANADAGDEIVLAKGTHVMASDITIDKSLSIHGAGEMDETIVDANHQKKTLTISAAGATISKLRFYQLGGPSYHQGFVVLSGASTIQDCRFTGCGASGVNSHGIVKATAGLIARCFFTDNTCDGSAGIWFSSGNAVAENCVFMNNTITKSGMASVGCLYFQTNDAIARNCTICNNTMKTEGAVYSGAWANGGYVNGQLYNCIVYNNLDSSGNQLNWYTRGLANNASSLWKGNCIYPLKGTGCTMNGAAANNVEVDPLLDSDGKPTLSTPVTVKEGATTGADYLTATDIIGVARGDKPSRGAYQYVVATGLSVSIMASPTEARLPATIALSAQVEGASGTLTYAWDYDNDGTVDSTEATPALAAVGTYSQLSLTVSDGTNSKKATYDGTLTILQRFMTNVVVSADRTAIRYPGTITFSATVGDGDAVQPFAYSWDLNGDGIEDSTAATPSVSAVGAYANPTLLRLTDANGLYSDKVVLNGTFTILPEHPQTFTVNPGESISSVLASAFDGDEVVLKKGTHVLTENLVLERPIAFRGEGENWETVMDGQVGSKNLYFEVKAAGARVSNLTFARFGHDYNSSGVVRLSGDSVISNVVVTGCGRNATGSYNPVYVKAGLLTHCWITNNIASSNAGVNMDGTCAMENCAILGNRSLGANKDIAPGSALVMRQGKGVRTVRNCTIAGNSFAWTNNVAVYTYIWESPGAAHFYNNIIWGNACTNGVVSNARNDQLKWYVKNNCWDYENAAKLRDPDGGTDFGTVNADPLFDVEKGGAPYLTASSPCRNASSAAYATVATVDILGHKRKVGRHVDIGCCEIPSTALMIICK